MLHEDDADKGSENLDNVDDEKDGDTPEIIEKYFA